MKQLIRGVVIAGAIAMGAVSAPADETTAVLNRIERQMASMNTLSTSFIQEKHLSVFKDTLVLKGSIFMQKPDLFAWHVREPMKYSMVLKGSLMKQWDEDTRTVQSVSLGSNPAIQAAIAQMKEWFSGTYASLDKTYEITVQSEHPVTLSFLPAANNEARVAIERVVVVFKEDETYIQEIRVDEKSGDRTVLRFSETLLNATLPPAAWDMPPR